MKKILFVYLICLVLLTGCHVGDSIKASKKSSAPKIVPGVVEVSGKLVNSNGKALASRVVHLAEVYRTEDSLAYLIDAGNNPSALTAKGGKFVIKEVPAGEYILWVGDLMGSHTLVVDETGSPRIWVVQGDSPLDMETIQLPK